MQQWLPLQTLIWLFPIVFILHDFEEIILVEKWIANKAPLIHEKLPKRIAARVVRQFSMTTAQFSVSVLIIFLFVSSSTYMANQYLHQGPLGSIHFFVVCTLVFFIHLFTHIGQAAFFRSLTPGALTSAILILPYSLILYHQLFANHVITWGTILTSLPFGLLIVPVILIAHGIGKRVI